MGSLRGEAGIAVCLLTLAAASVLECLLFRTSWRELPARLGLGRPRAVALLATAGICLLLVAYFPAFSLASGARIALRPDWLLMIPGLFAQHGLAEELLFRGFAFGHLRAGRSFWPAAWLSLLPFSAAHLMLFLSMEPVLAASSILVAVATSIPLAWLYERGRATIWAPALLHLGIHAIKLVEVAEAQYMSIALGWMAVCSVVPYAAFLFLRDGRDNRTL